MEFRQRLVATVQVIRHVMKTPGVVVAGSEVPNFMSPFGGPLPVVSLDIDIAVPVESVAALKAHLRELKGLRPSDEEPSVWVPDGSVPDLIEVNFIGRDSDVTEIGDCRVFDDPDLPMMVFGALSLLRPGEVACIEGVDVPLPRPAGLALEKLLSDRTGIKGQRDLLVALAILERFGPGDLDELISQFATLSLDLRHAVLSNATVLSLLEGLPGMPDPVRSRHHVHALLTALEAKVA